jgi:hypothetical protein
METARLDGSASRLVYPPPRQAAFAARDAFRGAAAAARVALDVFQAAGARLLAAIAAVPLATP